MTKNDKNRNMFSLEKTYKIMYMIFIIVYTVFTSNLNYILCICLFFI